MSASRVTIDIDEDVGVALDRMIADTSIRFSRQFMVESVLRDWLVNSGYLREVDQFGSAPRACASEPSADPEAP